MPSSSTQPSLILLATFGLLVLLCLIQLIASLRRKRMGTTPYCGACGYNLTGRAAESMRCPECGADLSKAAAVVIGQGRRSRLRIAIWGFLLGCSLAIVASVSVPALIHYPWIHFYPASWLIADIDGPPGQKRTDADFELQRRLTIPNGLSAASTQSLMEKLLQMHGDNSKLWDPISLDLFTDAAATGQITDEQVQRFMEQSVVVHLQTHPSVRRGKMMLFSAGVEFVRMADTLKGHFEMGDVLVNDKVVLYSFGPMGIQGTEKPAASMATNVAGTTHFAGVPLDAKTLAAIPDGPINLGFTVNFSLFLSGKFTSHRVQFSKQASCIVRLAPADAITDVFTVDKIHSAPADYGIVDLTVTDDHGKLLIEPRIKSPPIGLAMDVLVRSAGRTDLPWRSAGILRAARGSVDTWYYSECNAGESDGSLLDVLLRPSQDAADESNPPSALYCGNELLLPSVAVLPANSALQFMIDPSLRQKVTAAVRVNPINGGPKQYEFSVGFGASPVTLSMDCYIRAGSREQCVQRSMHWGSSDGSRVGTGLSGTTYGIGFTWPDGWNHVGNIDVILRPIPDSSQRPASDTKPWGEEIVFRNVPLPRSAAP